MLTATINKPETVTEHHAYCYHQRTETVTEHMLTATFNEPETLTEHHAYCYHQ